MKFRKKTLGIIKKANEIISEYTMSLTVRQIYYRFVGEQLIPNNLNSYKNLTGTLARAREEGLIDYESIVDRTRKPIKPNSWSSPESFFETVKYAYRRELLSDQETYIEVWLEKDALAGVIEPITAKYDIYLQIGRGYPSLSAIYQASERMQSEDDKEVKILYLGDFDPSGVDIQRDIGERLQNLFTIPVVIDKLALTKTDITTHKLPPAPAKSTDSRYDSFVAKHGDISVELDALPPDVLVKKVEKGIEDNLDMVKYQAQLEFQKEDKNEILDAVKKFKERR